MGVTKTEQFTDRQNQTANLLKALAHPARVAIVEHLLKTQTCVCGDLVNELCLAQPTISQHLKELKNAGIIQGTVEGTSVCYCLKEEGITELYEFLKQVLEAVKIQKNNCC
jgi:DNA-binding transcriptional ArsR family regulator